MNFFFNYFFKKIKNIDGTSIKNYFLKNSIFFNFNSFLNYLILSFNYIFNVKLKQSSKKKTFAVNNDIRINYIYKYKRSSSFFSYIRSFFFFEFNKNYKLFLFFIFRVLIFDLKSSFFFNKKILYLRKFLF
jgi:hypothetical protein